MAITNGFKKTKKYRKLSDGNYQLQSEWTSSQTVQMDNGKTLEEQMANLNVSDVSNSTVTYTQASNRTNIATGEKLSVAFGKIKKYFTDLKTVAFTGSYTDLSSKPSIPTVTNNLLATNSGTALDAVQGKAINDKIGTTDISAIGDGTVTGALSTLNSNFKKLNMICKLVEVGDNTMTFSLNYSEHEYSRLPVMAFVVGQNGFVGLYSICVYYNRFYLEVINGVNATLKDNRNGTVTIVFEQYNIWGNGLIIAPRQIINQI